MTTERMSRRHEVGPGILSLRCPQRLGQLLEDGVRVQHLPQGNGDVSARDVTRYDRPTRGAHLQRMRCDRQELC